MKQTTFVTMLLVAAFLAGMHAQASCSSHTHDCNQETPAVASKPVPYGSVKPYMPGSKTTISKDPNVNYY